MLYLSACRVFFGKRKIITDASAGKGVGAAHNGITAIRMDTIRCHMTAPFPMRVIHHIGQGVQEQFLLTELLENPQLRTGNFRIRVILVNIAAGIHRSVAKRVAGMALRIGKEPDVAMSGGVALNIGVVHAMEEELETPVQVHPYCQLAGAIGAAVVAWENLQKKG